MRTDIETRETHIAISRRRRRSWHLLIPALAVLGIVGGASTSAQAAQAAETMGDGFGPRELGRLLHKVNATAGQCDQIQAIWNGLRPQLRSFREQDRAVHQQITAALSAPTVDPAAVEQLRKQAMGIADQLSSTFTQGLLQTAQVLTADQRQTAAAVIAEGSWRFQYHHR